MTLIVLSVAFVAMIGCAGDEANRSGQGTEPAIVRTASDGPVSLELSVNPESVEVGQQASVSIEILAPRGVTVEIDDYRRALLDGDRRFEIGVETVAMQESVPIDAERLAWRYRYEVAPLLAGSIELPPVVVGYVDVRGYESPADGAGGSVDSPVAADSLEPSVVRTDPVTITAVDPPSAALTESDLHDIQVLDPVELERPLSYWAWIITIGVVLLSAILLFILRRRRKTITEQIARIPAHEWAWGQIARLVSDDLMTKGRVHEFYYRISDIARGYIERRFGVSAPEMTTEEFLQTSARDPRFSVEHRDGVGRFLKACDLVKYGRHIPSADQADELLATARTFIDRTRERSTMEERLGDAPAQSRERAA